MFLFSGPFNENVSVSKLESFVEKLPAVHTPDTIVCPPLKELLSPDEKDERKILE